MKLNYLILFTLIFSCTQTQEKKDSISDNDTIKTASGLQYYYLKRGEGRKIEKGSKVAAYNKLYLNDVDTVFWSTDESKDSVFTFIEGYTSLIKGATELYPLLREGDELVAIMPDSIAYGKEDNRGLPGGSTLIFNPIKIKSVSEPKKVISDTLFAAYQKESVDQISTVYQSIANSPLSNEYHMDIDQLNQLFRKMMDENDFIAVEKAITQLEPLVPANSNLGGMWYFKIIAVAQQGDTARAIRLINETIEKDPDDAYWKEMLADMTNKN